MTPPTGTHPHCLPCAERDKGRLPFVKLHYELLRRNFAQEATALQNGVRAAAQALASRTVTLRKCELDFEGGEEVRQRADVSPTTAALTEPCAIRVRALVTSETLASAFHERHVFT